MIEHSVVKSAQHLASLDDSRGDFLVQRPMIGNGASQVFEMFDVVEWSVVNDYAGCGWVGVWCRLVEHLRFAETNDQAEKLGGLRETVQHHLHIEFCVGHKGAVISKEDFFWRRVCNLFVLAVRRRRSKREPSKR